MSQATSPKDVLSQQQRPMLIWPLLVMLPLMYLLWLVPAYFPDVANVWVFSSFGPAIVALMVLLWWLFASRAQTREKAIGFAGIVAILVVQQLLCHYSMRDVLLVVLTLPITLAAFALGLLLSRRVASPKRTWISLLVAAAVASITLGLKSDGVGGNYTFDLRPRWHASPDQLLASRLEKLTDEKDGIAAVAFDNPVWATFRGNSYDGAQKGCAFEEDWVKFPPKELWRHEIGPAWSSFIAADKYLFTQEQRGEDECVVCYDGLTGQEVWVRNYPARFFEALGGLGPRATPTLQGTHLYVMGAEGALVKVNARTGEKVWQADLKAESNSNAPPMWGYSSSPLCIDGKVIVHAGGKNDLGILAFDEHTGKKVWSAAAGEMSYSSPHALKLLEKTWVVLLSEQGAHIYDPTTGKQELMIEWNHNGYRALQPRAIDGDKLLIASGTGSGTRLVQIAAGESDKLTSEVLWTSKDLKPDFNDYVIYQGHIYGFDNRIFACIDLQTGKAKWKGGRYEKGQALLLEDSGLIIVVSERGELVLLRATPEKHEELFKIQALNDKTWNHPIIVQGRLYLRNAKEVVCYHLPVRSTAAASN